MMRVIISLMFVLFACKGEKSEIKEVNKTEKKGKILMIIAPSNFRDEELSIPRDIFIKNGYEVVVASKGKERCKGMLGMEVKPDISVDEVNVEDYKGVVFVGGSGATVYFNDSLVLGIARKAYEKDRVIGAICLAPVILANAGLLKDREATVWHGAKDILVERGAIYGGDRVVVADSIVTAPGPHRAREFALKLLELLD